MITLTFKVAEDEARYLRTAARRAKLTLSEFLPPTDPSQYVGCTTGWPGQVPPHWRHDLRARPTPSALTTETVREMLTDFP